MFAFMYVRMYISVYVYVLAREYSYVFSCYPSVLNTVSFQKEAIHGLLEEVYHNSACKTWYKGGETTVTLSMKGVKVSQVSQHSLYSL